MINHDYLLSIHSYTVKNLNHVTTLSSASKNVGYSCVPNRPKCWSCSEPKENKNFLFRDQRSQRRVSCLRLESVLRPEATGSSRGWSWVTTIKTNMKKKKKSWTELFPIWSIRKLLTLLSPLDFLWFVFFFFFWLQLELNVIASWSAAADQGAHTQDRCY